MARPCFLVIDQEYSGSISTRKLVIETAKFNVLTVYSSQEAIETLRRFPAVDGVVIDAGMPDVPCEDLVRSLREIVPAAPIVAVGRVWNTSCPGADYIVETFDPRQLLAVLEKICPHETEAVEERNQTLKSHGR